MACGVLPPQVEKKACSVRLVVACVRGTFEMPQQSYSKDLNSQPSLSSEGSLFVEEEEGL